MNLRPALQLSLELAPAEAALRRCEDETELADAWFIWADNTNGARRDHLLSVHADVLTSIRRKEANRNRMLRHTRTL